MIQITCSKCLVVLTIDDAFAGGVCRCQFCGTIQTVPRELKAHGSPAAGRALMSKAAARLPDEAPSLDDLEQVVASSGLGGTSLSGTGTGLTGTGLIGGTHAGSGLAAAGLAEATLAHAAVATPTQPPTKPQPQPQLTFTVKHALLLCAWSLGMFVLGMLVTWLIMRASGNESTIGDHGRADSILLSPPAKPRTPAKPSFMGIELQGPSIVYLLDRGEASAGVFDSMKWAAIESAQTLEQPMAFQVIFWETDRVIVWPPEGTTPATRKNILACRNIIADLHASGNSRVEPALTRALSVKPSEIVLATGQSGLGDQFTRAVLAARKDPSVRIHTVSFGDHASPDTLKAIADQTGGQFRAIPTLDLLPPVD